MITYVLSVPVEQHDEYVANGWYFRTMDKERTGYVIVTKTVSNPLESGEQIVHIEGPKEPKLIQTAEIRRPLGKYRDSRFFDSVTLHNMNAEQFDTGIHASFKRMYNTRFAFSLFKAENLYIKNNNRSYALRIFTRLRGQELEDYVAWLIRVRERDIKTLRPSGFTVGDFGEGELPRSPDLWWDIQNDVIFSFDKNYMARLATHLEVSYSLIGGHYSSGSIRADD